MLLSNATKILEEGINQLIINEIINCCTLHNKKLSTRQQMKKSDLEGFTFYSITSYVKSKNEACLVTNETIRSSTLNRNRNIFIGRKWTETGATAKRVCDHYRQHLALISNRHQTLIDLLQSAGALSAEEFNTHLNQIILPIEDLHEGLRPIF